jgi:aspartate/methionine/tyrosine aminotransferase
MQIRPFELERYFARHEFTARYLLSSSDCEALTQSELLDRADDEMTAAWKGLKLGYTETRGHPLLLAAIAGLYPGLQVEHLLVTAPEEAIFLFMHALLQPGDHVVSTFPGYQSLYEIADSIGCSVDYWQPDETRGWYFDPGMLRRSLRKNTRLVVVNFPHNPTGFLPDPADFNEMVGIIRQQGAYLLSDEMYRHMELPPQVTLPAACELYERAFSLSGLSKAYGLPGLRIGWLAGQDTKLVKRVSELKDYTTICNSAPSEILAIIALRSRVEIIAKQMARLQRNLVVLERFFEDHAELLTWQRPQAGSVCFPGLRVEKDSFEFCEELVTHAGILLVPSQVFNFGNRHVRIGFGRENLPEVVAYFSDYLDQHFHA